MADVQLAKEWVGEAVVLEAQQGQGEVVDLELAVEQEVVHQQEGLAMEVEMALVMVALLCAGGEQDYALKEAEQHRQPVNLLVNLQIDFGQVDSAH